MKTPGERKVKADLPPFGGPIVPPLRGKIPPWLLIGSIVLVLTVGFRIWYFTPAVAPLSPAKDFTATAPNGQEFSLKDLRGQYVLLDFWGSWCAPCRRESPHLVDLNDAYPDKLNIVSVAIERDSAAWQRARAQDARLWPLQAMDQSSSLRFLNGPISDLYGVNQVPTHFFINPEGLVLGINLPFEEIRQILDAH
jgi:thiol-disulfide isomerase/thioredoxin